MKPHEFYIERCIQLAKNGLGTTYPNPMVGSVIVNNGKIIGEGWHYKSGMPHAEVNAIASVQDKTQLKTATLYVNLEPCSHFGKTPPCAQLIIDSGIRKVVIGNTDPNPKVAGRGIALLQNAGCEVVFGVLENECAELNKRFFTFHNKKRPYIFLKWAQTADRYIAPNPNTRTKNEPIWISNSYSKQFVHKMRAEEMAILVGTNTVLQDNPTLTTREWSGENPIRIVIDKDLKLDRKLNIFSSEAPTLIITENNHEDNSDTHLIADFDNPLPQQICDLLYKKEIQSVIIEGGTQTLNSFIESDLWDEAFVFTAPVTFGDGIKAPSITGDVIRKEDIAGNQLIVFKHKN